MKRLLLTIPALIAVTYALVQSAPIAADVRIRQDAAAKKIAIEIGGKPFTTYMYGPEYPDKSFFYPVMSPNGARVNREFPIVKDVPGETTDHPHHQGAFFAYDEVNGTNYWNPDATGRHIEHLDAKIDGNALALRLAWKNKDGRTDLEEAKRVTFGGDADVYWMDHDITLKAATVPVTMGDTKEGSFAIRLNDTLKEAGGSGRYINAEGLETAANVWGKTSPWVAIRGSVKDKGVDTDVTVAIFAHPTGLNFPPYWHARDYGLFAANPFARKGYDPAAPERITKLAVGESLRLGFRLAVYSGKVDKARLDRDFAAYKASAR